MTDPLRCYPCKAEADHLTSIKNPNPADKLYSIAVCDRCLEHSKRNQDK